MPCGYTRCWARSGLSFSPQRTHARSTVVPATLFVREHALRENFLRHHHAPGEKCGLEGKKGQTGGGGRRGCRAPVADTREGAPQRHLRIRIIVAGGHAAKAKNGRRGASGAAWCRFCRGCEMGAAPTPGRRPRSPAPAPADNPIENPRPRQRCGLGASCVAAVDGGQARQPFLQVFLIERHSRAST